MSELTYHDLKEEQELANRLIQEDKAVLVRKIINKNRLLDEYAKEINELQRNNEEEFKEFIKYKQKQYDEYLEKSNKLIKEKLHYKHITDDLEKWLEKICEATPVCDPKLHIKEILNKLQELKGSDLNE